MTYALLPLDNFVVINKSVLNDQDRYIVTLLYQPIIGAIATSLYFTLISYLDKNNFSSNNNTHDDLVVNMQTKLEDIKEAREKLEAIGLIKTYLKKGDVNNYIYEIYNPLTPEEFLNNPVLNTALYNNINKSEYKRIINQFILPKINLKGYQDITLSFKDVYSFVSSSKIENKNIKKANHLGLTFEPLVNINELIALIPEEMLNVRSITKNIKELIYQLSFVYNFDNETMSEIIKNSIEDRKINIDLLKENCRNYYKFESSGNIPKLIYQNQPLYLREEKLENTRKDKMIKQFESLSPYEYLSLKQNGTVPKKSDLETVEMLLIEQQLNPGVINVLIDYILRIKSNKLDRNTVLETAVKWQRENIKTVKEAFEFAKGQYQKRQNYLSKPEKVVTKRKVPSWVGKEIKEEYLSDEELEQLEKKLRGEVVD